MVCKVSERLTTKLLHLCPLLCKAPVQDASGQKLLFVLNILSNASFNIKHVKGWMDWNTQVFIQVESMRSDELQSAHLILYQPDDEDGCVKEILKGLEALETFQFASSMYALYQQCELVKMTAIRLAALPIITSPMTVPQMLSVVEDHFKYLPFVGSDFDTLGKGMKKQQHRRSLSF